MWLLGVVVAFVALGGCELARRRHVRESQPDLTQRWQRFMAQPVIIKGKARQPKLRKLKASRPKLRDVSSRRTA